MPSALPECHALSTKYSKLIYNFWQVTIYQANEAVALRFAHGGITLGVAALRHLLQQTWCVARVTVATVAPVSTPVVCAKDEGIGAFVR